MSEKEKFIDFVCGTFDELKKQFVEKQKQYGNADPFANFRRGALLKYGFDSMGAMYDTALDYEGKHIAHVYNNDIDGNKIDESLKDIAIYSIIELYMVECSKNLQKVE